MNAERRRAWLEPMPGTRILGVRPDGRLLLTPLLEVGVTAGGLVVAHDVSQAQAVWALLQQGGRTEVLGRPLKVNGRAGREVTLQDRDLLELEGASLRYREEVWAEPVEEALEAALRDDLSDRARWLVWADWLLEHGELATGQRVVAQASSSALLEGFEPLLASGGLEVDWRNGFPYALKLSCASGARDLGVLLSVLGLPCLRFLHTLEVDVASFVRRPRPEVPPPVLQVQAAAAGVLSTLAREGLPSLRRLVLGPVWEGVALLPPAGQLPFSPALDWLAEQDRSLAPAARLADPPVSASDALPRELREAAPSRDTVRAVVHDAPRVLEDDAARAAASVLVGSGGADIERGASAPSPSAATASVSVGAAGANVPASVERGASAPSPSAATASVSVGAAGANVPASVAREAGAPSPSAATASVSVGGGGANVPASIERGGSAPSPSAATASVSVGAGGANVPASIERGAGAPSPSTATAASGASATAARPVDALSRACPRLIRAGPGMSAAHVLRHRAVWLEPKDPAQPRILLQPGLRQDLGGIRLEFYEVGWAAVPALVAASSGALINGAPFGFGELRLLRAGDLLDGGHGLSFRVGVEWA